MNSRKTVQWLGLVALGVGLIVMFVRVLEMRFSDGDFYPYYASYRNDPLGTSAFHDSLNRLEGFTVERNQTALTRIKSIDENSALLLIGVARSDFEDLRAKGDSPVLTGVKEKGARLIVTVNPELVPEIFTRSLSDEEDSWIERRRKLREKKIREELEEENKEGGSKEEEGDAKEGEKKVDKAEESEEEKALEEEMDESMGRRLNDLLGVEIADVSSFERPDEGWRTRPGKTIGKGKVPAETPGWRSQLRFDLTEKKPWKTVLSVRKKPVVIERKWGKGTIVLASDSYFVSNEALHREAIPEFLVWLLGGKTKIIFDETIHGSTETGGAMKLIRRYRLHGLFFGLFIFIGLWAWKSATSLAPGDEATERGLVNGSAVAGQENGSGMVRLLQRSIPTKALLDECLAVFRDSNQAAISSKQERELEGVMSRYRSKPKAFSVVEVYRQITEILRKR